MDLKPSSKMKYASDFISVGETCLFVLFLFQSVYFKIGRGSCWKENPLEIYGIPDFFKLTKLGLQNHQEMQKYGGVGGKGALGELSMTIVIWAVSMGSIYRAVSIDIWAFC